MLAKSRTITVIASAIH